MMMMEASSQSSSGNLLVANKVCLWHLEMMTVMMEKPNQRRRRKRSSMIQMTMRTSDHLWHSRSHLHHHLQKKSLKLPNHSLNCQVARARQLRRTISSQLTLKRRRPLRLPRKTVMALMILWLCQEQDRSKLQGLQKHSLTTLMKMIRALELAEQELHQLSKSHQWLNLLPHRRRRGHS